MNIPIHTTYTPNSFTYAQSFAFSVSPPSMKLVGRSQNYKPFFSFSRCFQLHSWAYWAYYYTSCVNNCINGHSVHNWIAVICVWALQWVLLHAKQWLPRRWLAFVVPYIFCDDYCGKRTSVFLFGKPMSQYGDRCDFCNVGVRECCVVTLHTDFRDFPHYVAS